MGGGQQAEEEEGWQGGSHGPEGLGAEVCRGKPECRPPTRGSEAQSLSAVSGLLTDSSAGSCSLRADGGRGGGRLGAWGPGPGSIARGLPVHSPLSWGSVNPCALSSSLPWPYLSGPHAQTPPLFPPSPHSCPVAHAHTPSSRNPGQAPQGSPGPLSISYLHVGHSVVPFSACLPKLITSRTLRG